MLICLIMLLVSMATYHFFFFLIKRSIQEENLTELKGLGSNLILSFAHSVKRGTVQNGLVFQLQHTKISTGILFLYKETKVEKRNHKEHMENGRKKMNKKTPETMNMAQ